MSHEYGPDALRIHSVSSDAHGSGTDPDERSVGLSAVFAELDPATQLLDELARSGRVEIRWGGSNVKYVELRDRLTGQRASGRSFVSWNIALGQAAHKMRRLMAVEAEQ